MVLFFEVLILIDILGRHESPQITSNFSESTPKKDAIYFSIHGRSVAVIKALLHLSSFEYTLNNLYVLAVRPGE